MSSYTAGTAGHPNPLYAADHNYQLSQIAQISKAGFVAGYTPHHSWRTYYIYSHACQWMRPLSPDHIKGHVKRDGHQAWWTYIAAKRGNGCVRYFVKLSVTDIKRDNLSSQAWPWSSQYYVNLSVTAIRCDSLCSQATTLEAPSISSNRLITWLLSSEIVLAASMALVAPSVFVSLNTWRLSRVIVFAAKHGSGSSQCFRQFKHVTAIARDSLCSHGHIFLTQAMRTRPSFRQTWRP